MSVDGLAPYEFGFDLQRVRSANQIESCRIFSTALERSWACFRKRTGRVSHGSRYHPIISLRRYSNVSRGNGLVNKSASCSFVSTLVTVIWLGLSMDRNQCTLQS